MEATFVDMRRNPKRILDAIARNETVTLTYRGKPVARIEPIGAGEASEPTDVTKHAAFGMWTDREEMADPAAYVRRQRRGRYHDL